MATFSSSWLRIKFENNGIYTNDPFQGKTGFLFFICLETSSLSRFRVIEIITLRVQLLEIFKKCLTRDSFELFKKIKHQRDSTVTMIDSKSQKCLFFYCQTTQNECRLIEYYSEMIIFEDWKEDRFSKANHDLESAINLANLYWQGLDLT